MQGFSPKLPLSKDPIDGSYAMNKTALESIKQDLKMLLLTNPGERMMIPGYGVGLRSLLFSQNGNILRTDLSKRIQQQVNSYMSFIIIDNIEILTVETNENALYINLSFSIPSLNVKEQLNLALDAN